MRIFIDSDVIISSLISETGAAYFLIHKSDAAQKFVSNISIKEIELVISRMDLDEIKADEMIKTKFQQVKLTKSIDRLKTEFRQYVTDIDDAHIVAGAVEAKSRFLITYSIRHYNLEKINQELGILVITPGFFLQYLRSRSLLA